MRNDIHSVAPEDVMAYLDGELPVDEAARVAAHLGQCSDCQQIVADLRHVSRSTMAWEIEPHPDQIEPAQIPQQIVVALNERDAKPSTILPPARSWRSHWAFRGYRPWLWGVPTAALAAILVLFLALPAKENHQYSAQSANRIAAAPPPTPESQFQAQLQGQMATMLERRSAAPQSPALKDKASTLAEASTAPSQASVAPPPPGPAPVQKDAAPAAPMIARTAELTVIVGNLDPARKRLDEILRQHHGYISYLNVSFYTEGARALNATLSVPANQLDPILTDLKTLGRVENESQNGEEVTAQYVDLSARLQNARNTEARLTDLLRNRTGRLSDVLEVETEISRVRGEIEQMEAEKKLLETHVALSSIRIAIHEEFKARAQVVPDSTGTRFRNAAIDGYQTAINGLVAVLLWVISSGPTLLIWAAILFLPARYLWRRRPWRKPS